MDASALQLPSAGLIAGALLGYVARRNFFCTLTSLEQYWYGNNSHGVRTWVLAAVSAAIITQTFIYLGYADPSNSFYLSTNFGWLGAIIGGITFGIGMALIGTCAFGALIRLGGGSLKSLMAIIVLGLSAISAQRGLLSLSRTELFDHFKIDFTFAGNQSIPNIASSLLGKDINLAVTIVLIIVPLIWVFTNVSYRTNTKGMVTAATIGAVISLGWVVTSRFAEQSFDIVQIESASFVSPIGDTILQFAFLAGIVPDYGVGMIVGTVMGAALAACMADNVRWEACDDARELSRHILGAVFMGFGGVLAIGCTIGQGVSAASLLTISAPITICSILIGARLGLAWLIEGSIKAAFTR
ncbi:MAG: mmebrane protein [Hyphomicrobiales bacterium]|nr:YeeE/YedE family protein [Hyphomicrobiales bacterium]PCH50873.1 MAG: mmebrane protein [Hyphomicrobiales bacterium]PCH50970.1 MAG: mmebrane protein [Hyphomicrobiales bacterium]